jgi:hypothetical protein
MSTHPENNNHINNENNKTNDDYKQKKDFHNSPSFRHDNALVVREALFPVDPLWDKSWRPFPGESTIRKRINCLNPQLLFYTSWFCPFAQRTWIALEESKVKYKWKEVSTYLSYCCCCCCGGFIVPVCELNAERYRVLENVDLCFCRSLSR